MRFTIPLLAALALLSLPACTGDDGESAAPLPIEERFVTAHEAPGSKADPVETGQTTADFDSFIATLRERSVDPDEDEMTEVFQEAGFNGAGVDTRFYGAIHTPGRSTHVVSSFVELGSEDGATSALDWLETDVRKPCPRSCAVRHSTFEVDDLPNGRGVHSLATAEDIEKLGTSDQRPFESYWIGFTEGAITYTVDLFGRPGSVSEEQAQDVARAYHDRLTGG